MIEFFIAKRHIIERKFQSIVSILGIAIALTVFVVSLAISNGLKNNMLNSLLSLSPHVSVDIYQDYQEQYLDISKEFEQYDIKKINYRLQAQGLVSVNGYSTSTLIIGTKLEDLDINIVEGKIESNELTSVLVGNEFLKKTGTVLGDEITVLTSEMREIKAKISGVFKTGFYNYDSDLLLFPLETLQILEERGEVVSTVSILVDNPTNIEKLDILVRDINENYGDKVFARSWSMDNQSLLSAINFEKFVLVSILSLIILIASFAISVILNMIVREKITDIGILKATGYNDRNILKIFLFEGLIIGIVGMIISILLSPLIIIFLRIIFKYYVTTTYYLDTLPIRISIVEMIIIYFISFILILLSTILPSIKASKMNPTEAIKYNN
ncbi:FtsX-like permease family protein [Streptobacillus felis]|uniref:ABC transporter permease n=1 Tax=Streptobacillus felis TaxID=1384509 RepID=A0A7Z0PFG7_9FUSO|nr:FtsX-like permease family protein [Streptobacillus felis]NYV27210.1 ABC transporter permease [Streptobacillus felis]